MIVFPEPAPKLQTIPLIEGTGSPTEPNRGSAPHLQWPIRMIRNSTHLSYVEQDTPLEIAQCVGLVITARPGEFPDEPELGTDNIEFQVNGVPESTLTDAITRWEPRAEVDYAFDDLKQAVQSIIMTVEAVQ